MFCRCYRLFSLLIVIVSIYALMTGCSSDSSGSGGSTPAPTQTPSVISVTATPDSISPEETTAVKATVYDASGQPISGVKLIFTLDKPQVAMITSSATTGANGSATVNMTARNLSGEVNITATADTLSSTPITVTILSNVAPADMNLSVNPDSILVRGTASIKAEVFDSQGNHVPDGTSVSFKSINEIYGTFTSETATTNNGFATATFEAADQAGTASATVRSGNISKQVNFSILPAPIAGIQFLAASPQLIAIQGSGSVETSTIQFIVKDSNDNPVVGATVDFVLSGPNGGEYIDPPPDSTPKEITVSTNANGIAQVILHSGTVAGPVNITATTYADNGTGGKIPISAQSSVISIGGGVPAADRFGVAATHLNIAGADYFGAETQITAYLADRFGNYNILKGTTVSFISELGLAIDTSAIADENGIASVTARSQPAGILNIKPLQWELDLQNYIFQNYGNSINFPRYGRCSVLVYCQGEEHFDDTNANGKYDFGERFIDTENDPFVDYNDNGVFDGLGSADPQEKFIDANINGVLDGKNGVWDSEKIVFQNIKILLTTDDLIVAWSNNSNNFSVTNGGQTSFRLLVCDRNGNMPPSGTKLSISTDNGVFISGTVEWTYQESSAIGNSMNGQLSLIEFPLILADKDASDTDTPKKTTVTATVNWNGGSSRTRTYKVSVVGSVD